ncbi:protein NO VEIN domain-containing protein [Streptomyces chattanoogensis]|uniref:protein NO VEIN domain-containing protein n=1 Tax=Streptomyces chattanoogensis TaxID=66876 RepID=UPI00369C6E5D
MPCTRGAQELHVEVKGTTGAATSVELTINEVLHARDKDNTVDLYVVSDIKVDTRTAPYTPSEGTVSHYTDWEPAEEDLRPRKYEYRLPDTAA